MARIRTIKPEFFTHEGLAELSPLHRVLFIGLWTQADREGRLEDRPKRLKAVLLPYDDCEVDRLLADLASAGFLVRYQVDGKSFLQIPAFTKHQRPHPKEPVSEIPLPPCREEKRRAVKKNGKTMCNPSLREGKGKERKGTPYSPPGGDVVSIISLINELSGKEYKSDSAVVKGLVARLQGGASPADCLRVVKDRWQRWKDKPDMREHFNPVTLFRPANFEKYLIEARASGNGAESIEERMERLSREVSDSAKT